MKSGIVEIPDIILVTKSDLETLSNNTFADLVASKGYLRNSLDWEIRILAISAHINASLEPIRIAGGIGSPQSVLSAMNAWKFALPRL